MYRIIRASNSIVNMNNEILLRNLHLLDDKLRENNMRGEIDMYEGTVMCLGLNARGSTHDIDAVFAPKSDIRKLIREIAYENNLPDDWINDSVKGFVSEKGEFFRYDESEFTNLTVFMTTPEYLFAMKCLLSRLDYESSTEINDIKFLIEYLQLESVEDAENLILKYYPANRYKPKTHYMLEEIFMEQFEDE